MTKEPSMRGTANGVRLAAVLVAVAAWQGVGAAASSVTGTVTFAGTPPALKPLSMDADPVSSKKHAGPVPAEMLVLGPGNSMANIMVWVSKGVPAGKTYPAPKTPVVIDQRGCMYVPHVMGIMVGQQYKILNSDGVLHNIHTLPKINTPFNKGMPANLKEATTVFDKPGSVVLWTNCHHPFYDRNPYPEAAPPERPVWVGDFWDMFGPGHLLELKNLKAIAEYRHHNGLPVTPAWMK